MLFSRASRFGKDYLGQHFGQRIASGNQITSGPRFGQAPEDLAGLLTNLEERDVLFID